MTIVTINIGKLSVENTSPEDHTDTLYDLRCGGVYDQFVFIAEIDYGYLAPNLATNLNQNWIKSSYHIHTL